MNIPIPFSTIPALMWIFLLASSINGFSQDGDLDYLLDDGVSNQQLIIKTDLFSYIDGNYSLAAEFRKKDFAVEFAIGTQRMPLIRGMREGFWSSLFLQNDFGQADSIVGGNSLRLAGRLYTQNFREATGIDGHYHTLFVKRNRYHLPTDVSRTTNEIYYGSGIEYVTESGFVIDVNLAAGLRTFPDWEAITFNRLTYHVSLQIGYQIF